MTDGQNVPDRRDAMIRQYYRTGKRPPNFDSDPDSRRSFIVALIIMAGLPIGGIIYVVVI